MRIPLVSRVPLFPLALFAGGLFLVQQIQGTDMTFSGLCFAYILVSGLAFNIAGGLTRPAGGFIFSSALFTVIVGLVFKAFYGEPAQTNLQSPITDISIYVVSMSFYALLAALVKRIRPKAGLLAGFAVGDAARRSAFGCLVFGVVLIFITTLTSWANLALFTALRQVNTFLPMAVLLGVFYEARISDGRRSTNWIVWTAGLLSFFTGFVGFSKEGMFAPPLVWLLAAIAAGHNFTRRQLFAIMATAVFMVTFLVPFSQAGRNYRDEQGSFIANVKTAFTLATDLGGLRRSFLAAEKEASEDTTAPHYFDQQHGLVDRLTIFGPDDALITYTDTVTEEGYLPTVAAYSNIIPHFIWPGKPFLYTGNLYAREIGGVIGDEDESTGISFSPSADAYHQGRWVALSTVLPVTIFLLFFITESLAGDVRKSPWGLLFILGSAHSASEGMISGQVYIFSVGAFGVTFVAFMSRYVLPHIGGVLLNQDRTRVKKGMVFQSAVRPASSPGK